MISAVAMAAWGVSQFFAVPIIKASAYESQQQWNQALVVYWSQFATGSSSIPNLHDHIRHCQQRLRQVERTNDGDYSKWLAALTIPDALKLYQDVLDHLGKRTPLAEKATPKRLFAAGAAELTQACQCEGFRKARLSGVNIAFLKDEIRLAVAADRIRTIADAKSEVRELIVRIITMSRHADGVAMILEMIHGACAAIDEWTVVRPQKPSTPSMESVTAVAMTELPVGYLKIVEFRESTVSEFNAAVGTLIGQGAKALIVDLRGNTGGLLSSGVELSKRLVPEGEILRTTGRDPAFAGKTILSESGFAALPIPLVLLVDAETMSTAEIVADAVQANGRGKLVGMPTFGKGSIQSSVTFKSAGASVLIMTVAYVQDRQGHPRPGHRIEPDRREADPDTQIKAAVEEAKSLLSTRHP